VLLLSAARCAGSLFEHAELIFRDVCAELCGCEHQRGGRLPTARTLQLMSAAGETERFASVDAISARGFGGGVDVNYNAGSVIPVAE